MRNKIIIIIIFSFLNTILLAENINIQSKNIVIDKKKETTVFEGEVKVITEDNTQITSDYANYNKKTGLLILKENIIAIDEANNILETNYAEFSEYNRILKSVGPTKIITTEKYIIDGQDKIR